MAEPVVWKDKDLITAEKLNAMQQVAGPKGANGKNGSDAKQIKSGVINEDKNGIVTGITVTFTDNKTVDFSVNKATE